MKSKSTIYLLGGLVLLIWGTIIYRIVLGLQSEDEAIEPVASKINKQPYDDYSIRPDTDKLLLNYRDPFGLTPVKMVDSVKSGRPVIGPKRPPGNLAAPSVISWDAIRYSGYIRNPETRRLISVVSIQGKSAMLQEGETQENLKLIKNLKDSIKVNYRGTTRYIRLNHN